MTRACPENWLIVHVARGRGEEIVLTKDEFIKALKNNEIFSGLGNGELEALWPVAHEQVFQDGEIITRAGESADHVYAIVDGMFESTDERMVRRLGSTKGGPGIFLGVTPLAGAQTWTVSTRAQGQVQAIAFPMAELKKMMHNNAGTGYIIMRRVAQNLLKRL